MKTRSLPTSRRHRRPDGPAFVAAALVAVVALRADAVDVSIVPIDSAFAANSMNHVAFRQSALKTVGNQQFAAYYDDAGLVTVARRTLGTAAWEVFNTSYIDNNSNLTDDHNVITFGVDGDGFMHLSWGMHNHSLRYIRSTAPVTGGAPVTFGAESPMTGAAELLVTYPQFYDLPGGDLLFTYRTGSSGNGDQQVNRYDNATNTWAALHRPLFDGEIAGDGLSSKNAYANTLAFDSQGDLHFSWTLRDTPDFQTNQNLYYAKSTDNAATWVRSNGTSYPLPFGEVHSELAVAIPQQSSLINQTSMTVDANDRPVIATWWAPGAQQGDHTRQYMLVYHDGTSWQTSQITQRNPEPKQGAATVRDLARPVVLVDDDNRVLVAMRYDERGDVLTVAHSQDRQNWEFIDLATDNLGTYEPNYDVELWKRENKLHLLYQPVGLGQASSTISVLEWDAGAYFDALDGPRLMLRVDRSTGVATLVNPTGEAIALEGLSLTSPSGQLDPVGWFGLSDQGVVGWQRTGAAAGALTEGATTALSVPSGASATLGGVFNPSTAFGADAQADLAATYQNSAGATVTAVVEYVGESFNNLTLWVDPTTGAAHLENTSRHAVAIEAYTVASPAGTLRPSDGQWLSLDDAGVAAWSEANPSPTRVSELAESGELLLVPADGYDLGALVAPAGPDDLVFEFLVAGSAVARRGVVRYASLAPELTGDFNADGAVDAADYTVWRDLSQGFSAMPNDATPGLVSPSDDEDWRANLGRTTALATVVPEPCGVVLVAVALGSFVGVTRSRRA